MRFFDRLALPIGPRRAAQEAPATEADQPRRAHEQQRLSQCELAHFTHQAFRVRLFEEARSPLQPVGRRVGVAGCRAPFELVAHQPEAGREPAQIADRCSDARGDLPEQKLLHMQPIDWLFLVFGHVHRSTGFRRAMRAYRGAIGSFQSASADGSSRPPM